MVHVPLVGRGLGRACRRLLGLIPGAGGGEGDPWSWRRRSLPRFPAKLPGQEIGSLVKNRAVVSRTIYTVLWSDLTAAACAH